jgi:hypothetical protein
MTFFEFSKAATKEHSASPTSNLTGAPPEVDKDLSAI